MSSSLTWHKMINQSYLWSVDRYILPHRRHINYKLNLLIYPKFPPSYAFNTSVYTASKLFKFQNFVFESKRHKKRISRGPFHIYLGIFFVTDRWKITKFRDFWFFVFENPKYHKFISEILRERIFQSAAKTSDNYDICAMHILLFLSM